MSTLSNLPTGLEIIRGADRNKEVTQRLIQTLKQLAVTGTLYIGYPIVASVEESYTVESLLVSEETGLVAFHFPAETDSLKQVQDIQDRVYFLVQNSLGNHENLRHRRQTAVVPNVISFYSACPAAMVSDEQYKFADPSTLQFCLKSCTPVSKIFFPALCAAIQRVASIKPVKKRENVKNPNSKGSAIKVIERGIANLDHYQKKASIEAPEGPQRVRGLAGSGKTVVLALKAAYLHTQHPDWTIAVVFHTRSLSQQFFDLIERFTMAHSGGDKPNWDRLHIKHAWGSSYSAGIYYDVTEALNIPAANFSIAKAKYGADGAFAGICNELLVHIKANQAPQLYDCVLIDEAQDLPPAFFQIVYAITKRPKRIVWAYDELQHLENGVMPTLDHLFGTNEEGLSNVIVQNQDDEAAQDIILPVCYRNTPWALTLAHALGFGIYRQSGLVQLFKEVELWEDIGYTVESGQLALGRDIVLKRGSNSYPRYFDGLITPADAIVSKYCDGELEQYAWVAAQINANITVDELDPDDILIILPEALSAKSAFKNITDALAVYGIGCHLAGVSTERDVFVQPGSVTVSHIYRAKGNEAPMVYVVNADFCAAGTELIKLRNILFTSITRSRAWVRISGVGENMKLLEQEIQAVKDNGFKLKFRIPTQEQLEKLRDVYRDRTDAEKNQIRKFRRDFEEMKKTIKSGVLDGETLRELQDYLARLQAEGSADLID